MVIFHQTRVASKRLTQTDHILALQKRDAGYAAGALLLALYAPVLVRLFLSLWRVALGNRHLPPLTTALKVGTK